MNESTGEWTYTNVYGPWQNGFTSCPPGTSFSAPRNGAQNDALTTALGQWAIVWVNQSDAENEGDWRTYLYHGNRSWGWEAREHGAYGGSAKWGLSTNGSVRQYSSNYGYAWASGTNDLTVDTAGTLLVRDGLVGAGTYEANLQSSDDGGMGLVFHFQDDANYFSATINEQQKVVQLTRRSNWAYRVWRVSDPSLDLGSEHQLKVVVSAAGNVSIYVNNVLKLQQDIGAQPQGRYGLYTWACQDANFTHVKFTP